MERTVIFGSFSATECDGPGSRMEPVQSETFPLLLWTGSVRRNQALVA